MERGICVKSRNILVQLDRDDVMRNVHYMPGGYINSCIRANNNIIILGERAAERAVLDGLPLDVDACKFVPIPVALLHHPADDLHVADTRPPRLPLLGTRRPYAAQTAAIVLVTLLQLQQRDPLHNVIQMPGLDAVPQLLD